MAEIKDLEATIPYPSQVMDERTTRILDTAIFQYIARQLWELRQLLEAERREGEVTERRFEDITSAGKSYGIRKNLGVEFSIADVFNEGPNTVFVRVNSKQAEELTLWAGQGIVLNHEKAKKKLTWLHFRCGGDETATVRVIGQF
jgi:predicted transcriptional regulator